MGRSMNMATVAEGIETQQQAASMTALGCTYGQGFYFSHPLIPDDVVKAFAAQRIKNDAPVTGPRPRRAPARVSRPSPAA